MEGEIELKPGQVWCWGSSMHASGGDRLWLVTEVLTRQGGYGSIRDAMAVDLETGEHRRVNNLPVCEEREALFVKPTTIAWRRIA